MARIRGKDTKPELLVRTAVHARGYRFRLHRKDIPGCPDLVFPKHQLIIFVHGCFWHQHEGCSRAHRPRSRQAFWDAKLNGNVERDVRTKNALSQHGWHVEVIWECDASCDKCLQERLNKIFGT